MNVNKYVLTPHMHILMHFNQTEIVAKRKTNLVKKSQTDECSVKSSDRLQGLYSTN